jgi:hypothetical protein
VSHVTRITVFRHCISRHGSEFDSSAGEWILSRTSSTSSVNAGGSYSNDVTTYPDPNPVNVSDSDNSSTAAPIAAGAGSSIGTAPNYAGGAGSALCGYGPDDDDVAWLLAESATSAWIITNGYGEVTENEGWAAGAGEMEIVEVSSGGTFSIKATVTIDYEVDFTGTGDVYVTGSGGTWGYIWLDDWEDGRVVQAGIDFTSGSVGGWGPEDTSDSESIIFDGQSHEFEFSYTWENMTLNDVERISFQAYGGHGANMSSGYSAANRTLMLGSGAKCKIEIIPE